ncbi:MAG: hypothetical protein IJ002_08005 [Clostridia bacterium]|nr:hypothetical protein [Clostridia bacterium]
MKKKEKNHKVRDFYRAMIQEYRTNKLSFLLYIILRTIVIAIAVLLFLNGSYESAMLCVFTLILFLLPAFVQKTFKVELPTALEIIVLVFIFAAEILGELAEYYVKIPIWDTMLHITTGFLAAAMGLSLIDLLNRSDRFNFKLSPFFVAMVSFCFSMTIGVLWEFFEFGADCLLRTDMQKDMVLDYISSVALNPNGKNDPVIIDGIIDVVINGESLGVGGYLDIGLFDTMKDLIVNFIGAAVFSVIGYFYSKYKGKSKGSSIVQGLKIEKKKEE